MATLIEPTTSAVAYADDSGYFDLGQSEATISADSLAGTEEVDIQYSANDGATWGTVDNESGPVTLTATQKQVVVRGAGRYRVAKDATASECGVYVRYDRSP